MENSMQIPQKIKNRTTVWSSNPIWVHKQRKWKQISWRDICTSMFTAAKTWKRPEGPPADEWMKMWCTCSHEKLGKSAICNHTDGSWGHCAKWNTSDGETQTLYGITCTWNLKKPDPQKQRTGWWFPGTGVGETREYWSRVQTPNYEMTTFWGIE